MAFGEREASMEHEVSRALADDETGRVSRRQVVRRLACSGALSRSLWKMY